MKNQFFVTGLGLKIDKVMIMPGSTLTLNTPAPGHWSRFGTSDLAEAEQRMEAQHLTVATPAAAVQTSEPTGKPKTKKRQGLEQQATDNSVEFTDEMSDDDLLTAIKAKKAAAA
ncbi:hypothetical protein GCM10007385_35460 [Tateyamaria omphalii]|uniref:hypothetical protein n=1 Tax=Tateyamaria omphalii TaxID=299262 RepID=UPI0016745156|nr:hypothetical protein [Tateyamaria omphalii]GGX63236.1 hypothetical protein GCM10007385_35460 [Tateyamaria omphalii]